IARHWVEQADFAGIDGKARSLARTVAEIGRYSAERAVLAEPQHDDGLGSRRLDHLYFSGDRERGVRRIAEISGRLGDAFGANAKHDLAANPACGAGRYREPDRCPALADDGHRAAGRRL